MAHLKKLVYSALALLALPVLSACGTTTRALVRNNAESTTTSISITTRNAPTTTVTVAPDVDVE